MNPATPRKRLFFALWPDPEAHSHCQQLALALANTGQVVKPANLHVTLLFLGAVDMQTEKAVLEGAAAIRGQAIALPLDQLRYWNKPALICLCARQAPEPLLQLVTNLQQLAQRLGLRLDDRPYQAHVTLVRKAHTLPVMSQPTVLWQSQTLAEWPLHD